MADPGKVLSGSRLNIQRINSIKRRTPHDRRPVITTVVSSRQGFQKGKPCQIGPVWSTLAGFYMWLQPLYRCIGDQFNVKITLIPPTLVVVLNPLKVLGLFCVYSYRN